MADKKKMTVAEILAAARKSDGGAAGKDPVALSAGDRTGGGDGPGAGEGAQAGNGDSAPSGAKATQAKSAAVKAKPAGASGGKPSVSEILAMARAGQAAAATQQAEKAPQTKQAPGPKAKPKPAPKAGAKPAAQAEQPAKTLKGAIAKDTASILAAARSGAKPGPMSKSQAAEAVKTTPAAKTAVKPRRIPPPIPAKPDYAKAKDTEKKAAAEDRRWFVGVMFGSFLGLGFSTMAITSGLWSLGFVRFMFPNVLTEPPSKFKVGFPDEFPPGSVEEKFKAQFGVWIVNTEYDGNQEIFALRSVCTHLGCTPNWLEAEQKFKCPCHGSGFYKDGINYEGPAPRPLERYAISVADDGQLEVDKSKLFQEEIGQWTDPESFVSA